MHQRLLISSGSSSPNAQTHTHFIWITFTYAQAPTHFIWIILAESTKHTHSIWIISTCFNIITTALQSTECGYWPVVCAHLLPLSTTWCSHTNRCCIVGSLPHAHSRRVLAGSSIPCCHGDGLVFHVWWRVGPWCGLVQVATNKQWEFINKLVHRQPGYCCIFIFNRLNTTDHCPPCTHKFHVEKWSEGVGSWYKWCQSHGFHFFKCNHFLLSYAQTHNIHAQLLHLAKYISLTWLFARTPSKWKQLWRQSLKMSFLLVPSSSVL